MVHAQACESVGDLPCLERPVDVVVDGNDLETVRPGFRRPRSPGPVGVDRDVTSHGEQPGPDRVRISLEGPRVTPSAKKSFLDDVLRPLSIAVGESEGITEQGTRVHLVERANERLVGRSVGLVHSL